MIFKKAVVLLHLSLFLCAIFFVKNTIEEFLEGNTIYITTQEPLTPNDLPTVTITVVVSADMECLELSTNIDLI